MKTILTKRSFQCSGKLSVSLVSKKIANFFAENCPKTVIITLTPDVCFFSVFRHFELGGLRRRVVHRVEGASNHLAGTLTSAANSLIYLNRVYIN
jgi:hypothetical protein